MTKNRPELCGFYLVPVVWGQSHWETPAVLARPLTGEQQRVGFWLPFLWS